MSPEFLSLIDLSARIGQDLSLVQAGGGNTSIKLDEMLWIKASGKWLAHAKTDDMFVPVPLSDIKEKLKTGDERFGEYPTRSGVPLRPSVETTMHGVLPHRVVVHVHSAATIAVAAQADGPELVRTKLNGLRWSWIPYIHPGVPLARAIRDLAPDTDVLVLGNHGLVIAADTCRAAEGLLRDVEQRLSAAPALAPPGQRECLNTVCGSAEGWAPAADSELHALGTMPRFADIVSGGTMYPDHCVYLGPAAPIMEPSESLEQALGRYRARHNYNPSYVIVRGAGVLTSSQLTRAGRELLFCLKRVVERIPEGARVSYLEDWQVAKLMNWDAEKYRISMAQRLEGTHARNA